MDKRRVEAFSDGVIAVIITIMVLEMRAPAGAALADLKPLIPVFASYVLSFVYIGIYWNNHHHMLHLVRSVNGAVLWANLHQLFWLSIVPFATAWMGEHPLQTVPLAAYGLVLLANALSWVVMQRLLIQHEGRDSPLAQALSAGFKEKISPLLYVLGIVGAFVFAPIAYVCYVAVACIWFIPDRRVERQLGMR